VKRFEATVTSKGQVTLPAPLRAALGLKAGDKLIFCRGSQGEVTIEAQTHTLACLQGVVNAAPRKIDGDQIARWIEESRGARWRADRSRP
jgi:AbrB family looped-hinge helix DNA binding protein